jgi:CotS family spore coat protein
MEEIKSWTGESRLDDYLLSFYNLRIIQAKPMGGVLYLKTDQGPMALKRVRKGQKDRFKLILELSEHLEKIDLIIPTPILTAIGKPYFDGFHYSYVLMPWIKANPVQLLRLEEWQQVSRFLAFFHKTTKNFTPSYSYRKYQETGKWLATFKQTYRQLELFQIAARWTNLPTEVDKTWLSYASYIKGITENLIEYYLKIGGDKTCKETVSYSRVCHNNIHRKNLLITHDDQIYLIDWNDVTFNTRSADLARWLQYAYGRTGSIEVLKWILRAYQEVSPLIESEYALIYTQLLFPHHLFRVLKAFYSEQTLGVESAKPYFRCAAKIEGKKLDLLKKYTFLIRENWHISVPEVDWMENRG